ncbi:zinc ABC transporter substrate-binding protein [Candidatus Poribacteria bacterium]|nr:zinc ABC transporter substrate-binding protein [Candidatus Poribacteria bacterium]
MKLNYNSLHKSCITFTKIINIHIFLGCLLIFNLFILTGCNPKKEEKLIENEKIRVVTTIGMITDIVRNVGGDKLEVIGMMGPGVDPHLYKPTLKDIERLKSASIIFYNGLHLESKMGDKLEQLSGNTKVVAVSENIPTNQLLKSPEFKGQYDPHIWFDINLWIKAVETVHDTLVDYNSESKATFGENTENYISKLRVLHEYVIKQSERVPPQQRVLVTAHDAFNYFGNAYGFEVRGLQGMSTVSEAGIADVKELASYIAEHKIPAIFVESSVPVRSLEAVKAAVISKGFNVEIGGELFSDAMGNEGTPEGTYIGMVRHNIDTIISALLGESIEIDSYKKEQ